MNKITELLEIEKTAAKAPAGCVRPDESIDAKKLRRAKNERARKLRQAAAKKRRAARLVLSKENSKIAEALLVEKVALSSQLLRRASKGAFKKSQARKVQAKLFKNRAQEIAEKSQPGKSIGEKIRSIVRKRPKVFGVPSSPVLIRNIGRGI